MVEQYRYLLCLTVLFPVVTNYLFKDQSREKGFIWLPFLAYCQRIWENQGDRILKRLVTPHPQSVPDSNA